MSYSVQLLPNAEEARVIRDALAEYQQTGVKNDAENDICWKYISQISIALTRKGALCVDGQSFSRGITSFRHAAMQ